jgi:hypothetical protein
VFHIAVVAVNPLTDQEYSILQKHQKTLSLKPTDKITMMMITQILNDCKKKGNKPLYQMNLLMLEAYFFWKSKDFKQCFARLQSIIDLASSIDFKIVVAIV